MEATIRERILDCLNKNDSLTSEEISVITGLGKRQVQEANTALLLQKKIINNGKRPFHFALSNEKADLKPYTKATPKNVSKPLESFDFNKYMILYVTNDSPRPKMLHEFEDVKELTKKFEELQKSSKLVSIAAYQKLEVVKKFELRI